MLLIVMAFLHGAAKVLGEAMARFGLGQLKDWRERRRVAYQRQRLFKTAFAAFVTIVAIQSLCKG